MRFSKWLMVFGTALMFGGCLVGNKISYNVQLDEKGGGTAEVIIHDIRSDAQTDLDFEEDKSNLFQFMLKSPDFVTQMMKEGKYIKSRELFVEDGKLNGKIVYTFNKLSDFENLMLADGFYFITAQPEDEVVSTNGQVVNSDTYKRIMWSADQKNIQFEMLIEPAGADSLRGLAKFYQENVQGE